MKKVLYCALWYTGPCIVSTAFANARSHAHKAKANAILLATLTSSHHIVKHTILSSTWNMIYTVFILFFDILSQCYVITIMLCFHCYTT